LPDGPITGPIHQTISHSRSACLASWAWRSRLHFNFHLHFHFAAFIAVIPCFRGCKSTKPGGFVSGLRWNSGSTIAGYSLALPETERMPSTTRLESCEQDPARAQGAFGW
jgi:hypothetical protein